MNSFKDNVLGGNQGRYDKVIRDIGFDGVGAVLDAGCGYGQWSRALSRNGNRVTAIDIDGEKLDLAVDLHDEESTGVMYYLGDMKDFGHMPDGGYDAIFSYSAIYWTGKYWPEVLANWYNLLKPGGELYFTTDDWGYFLTHPMWAARALWAGARPMCVDDTVRAMVDVGFINIQAAKDPFYSKVAMHGLMGNVFAVYGVKPE